MITVEGSGFRVGAANAYAREWIARNFKDLAMEGKFADKEKGIKGLAIWGGKHSVPFLIDLLEEPNSFVKEHVFRALGELKDERQTFEFLGWIGVAFFGAAAVLWTIWPAWLKMEVPAAPLR